MNALFNLTSHLQCLFELEQNNIINQFKESYNLFNREIEEEIKNKKFSYNNIDCFLFNSSWEKLLNDSNGNFNNYYPEFKTNFLDALQSLEKNDKLKLLFKSTFELIINSKALNIYKVVKYYAGYNKLIIEYKRENEPIYDIILFINPLEPLKNKVFITFQIKDNNKMELYKTILSKNINNKYINEYSGNNNIIIFPSFKGNINNENKDNKLKNTLKKYKVYFRI